MTVEQFERAVQQHRDRVFGFALHFLHNRQEAEDVTQDVLIRLWDNRETVAPETIGAWLLRVARNACVDQYRKRRTRNRIVDASFDACDDLVATTRDPDSTVDSERLREKILTSVNQLKEPYKSIVVLREIQDLSYEEISEALELPLTTVKVYLHRGRRTLRLALNALYREFVRDGQVNNATNGFASKRPVGDESVSNKFVGIDRHEERSQTKNQTAV